MTKQLTNPLSSTKILIETETNLYLEIFDNLVYLPTGTPNHIDTYMCLTNQYYTSETWPLEFSLEV